jgi:hypothetical protein
LNHQGHKGHQERRKSKILKTIVNPRAFAKKCLVNKTDVGATFMTPEGLMNQAPTEPFHGQQLKGIKKALVLSNQGSYKTDFYSFL